MDYTITNLTTVADCNFLLKMAQNERADLDVKRHADERGVQKFADSSVALETEYQTVLAEISITEQLIQGLAEGTPARKKQENKLFDLNYKKHVLETRKEAYGVIKLLEKQKDFTIVQLQITELDAFIDAIKARKDQLAA